VPSTLPAAVPLAGGTDEIIRVLRQLPSTPKVLPRLLEFLRDDNTSIDDVVDLIKVDAGMTSRVLQIANSAFYTASQSHRCPSMEDAISRVGLVKVYELVAVAATTQVLMRNLRVYGLTPEEMWQKSVTCAIAAERLASRCQLESSTAYTAGLLHGVGLVAIDAWAEASNPRLRLESELFPDEASRQERQALGVTNAAVGAALLRHWGFPPSMVEPIRWQYVPGDAGLYEKTAAVIHLAKWLRDAVSLPQGAPPLAPPADSVLKSLLCSAEELDEMLPDLRWALERASLLLAEPKDE